MVYLPWFTYIYHWKLSQCREIYHTWIHLMGHAFGTWYDLPSFVKSLFFVWKKHPFNSVSLATNRISRATNWRSENLRSWQVFGKQLKKSRFRQISMLTPISKDRPNLRGTKTQCASMKWTTPHFCRLVFFRPKIPRLMIWKASWQPLFELCWCSRKRMWKGTPRVDSLVFS